MGKTIDRRGFIIGAGALGISGTTGLLLGCGKTDNTSTSNTATSSASQASSDTPSFMQAPTAIPSNKIVQTIEADIVIIGAGLSGICACRAALEAGASNIVVIEKASTFQYRSNQVGCIGGQLQKDLGIEIDKNAAVAEIMRECGYRPKQRILNLWAENSGEAFDWYLSPSQGKYVVENEADSYDGTSMSVRKAHWPHPADAHTEDDYYPLFDDCQILLPDHGPYLENVERICLDKDATFMYSTWARQLLQDEGTDGGITGVITQDVEGNYRKVTASKAILLATGDYSGNAEMVSYYTPWAARFTSIFPNTDAAGEKTNIGEGQCMGMWVGAKMEDGPHAPMTHHLGSPLGVDAFLLVDVDGDRFMNEDVGGQLLQNQISRLPQKQCWQIFDAAWPDQIGHMDTGHGNVDWCVETSAIPAGSYGRNAYTSKETMEAAVRETGVVADTIEELAAGMGIETAKLVATIARYNALAANGSDGDFGKRADRLFGVTETPFYAYPLTDTALLVTMGGLQTTLDFEVTDTDDEVIKGLYAVGNTQGGRFLVDYPLAAPGISHGMAITHGMLVGRLLAKL